MKKLNGRVYRGNCKQCGRYYEGYGKNHCSLQCSGKDPIRNKKISNSMSTRIISKETRSKIALSKIGHIPWNKGLKYDDSMKARLDMSGFVKKFGKDNPNWRGGIMTINTAIRESLQYEDWRKKVFERDGYTCQLCGEIGGRLEADHIKIFSLYPELRFDINNGQTLCKTCHRLKTREDLKENWSNQYKKREMIYAN